jgi:GNAT superfamily N-acetyltransferase
MRRKRQKVSGLTFKPATKSAWPWLEELFGPRGACGGCWCMWWRLTRSEFDRMKGEANRRAMKKIVESGQTPGILAFDGARPVGWCAIGPRERYPSLQRSRVLAPLDDLPVWSIVCFFIAKEYRKRGLTSVLIRAALEHAKKKGAKIVEAYPVEPNKGPYPDTFAYTGFASTFRALGFKEVARRSATRAIYRVAFPGPRRAGT